MRFLIFLSAVGLGLTTPLAAAANEHLAGLRGVWRAFLNHDGSRVLVQIRGGQMGLWNVDTGRPVAGDLGVMTQEGQVAMDASGRRFLAAAGDGRVRLHDARTAAALSPPMSFKPADHSLSPASFSPDLSTLVLFHEDQRTFVFDAESGRRLAELPSPADAVESAESSMHAQFTADGAQCFIMDPGGVLRCYETSDWSHAGKPLTHPNRDASYYGFEVSPDGHFAVTFDGPGENGPKGFLQLWDLEKRQPLGEALAAQNGLNGTFLPGGDRLLVTPARGLASVRALPGLERQFDLRQHDDVSGPRVASTRDGRWLLTWGYDSSLLTTNAATGKIHRSMSSHANVSNAILSPDSAWCYAVFENSAFSLQGHHDHYVLRLDVPNLETKGAIRILEFLHGVTLAADGSRLLLHQGTTDHERLRVFDAATMKEIVPP